jgi:hypothetical protein
MTLGMKTLARKPFGVQALQDYHASLAEKV